MRLIIYLAALALAANALAKDYNGAELYTLNSFKYGRFEARMLMPAGSGLVSSMFTYYNFSYKGGVEPWCEIDMEVLGKNPSSFQSNIISGNLAKKVTSEEHHSVTPATNATYHTYAIEWTPDYIAWYLDGVQVRKTTGAQATALQAKEQSLRFNIWASEATSWVGVFNTALLPVHQIMNWVKVYDYTPGAGEGGSNFTLAWQDDFDSFDDTRWGTGNWTFAENYVDFSPENVTVRDGYLVLSLTNVGNTGFTGTIPVDDGSTPVLRPSREPVALLNASARMFDLLGREVR